MKTERKFFTILDLFGQIGGVHAIIIPIGAWMVDIFSSKIYLMTLLNLFYQVEERKKFQKVIPTDVTEVHVNPHPKKTIVNKVRNNSSK